MPALGRIHTHGHVVIDSLVAHDKLDSLAEEPELCDSDPYPDRGPKDVHSSLFARNQKNLRRMATLMGEQVEFCSQTITSRLQSHNLFNDDRQLLEELVVIRSYQGCPEQGRHSDYNAEALAEVHDTCIPLSVLWALEDGSQLILFGRNGTRVVLPVLKGKFVVFRGDSGHAGAGYKQMGMRVHCYVSLKDQVQRLENKTYFMSQHFFVPKCWASWQQQSQTPRPGHKQQCKQAMARQRLLLLHAATRVARTLWLAKMGACAPCTLCTMP